MRDDAWLLTAEIDAIYGLTPGPSASLPGVARQDVLVVLGWSPTASVLAVRDNIRRMAVPVSASRLMRATERFEPEQVPGVICDLRAGIERLGLARGVTVTGWPSFVFGESVAAAGAELPLVVSDRPGMERARLLDRPANWEPDEWADLLTGEHGSWAMAVCGNSPVSICHTSAATGEVAEAGVWTREDHRGRHLAPAVTRAWWERERLAKEVLFYSTSSDNRASRAVARKLGLRPLGWLWTIREWVIG